jgi:hypothetical protein
MARPFLGGPSTMLFGGFFASALALLLGSLASGLLGGLRLLVTLLLSSHENPPIGVIYMTYMVTYVTCQTKRTTKNLIFAFVALTRGFAVRERVISQTRWR